MPKNQKTKAMLIAMMLFTNSFVLSFQDLAYNAQADEIVPVSMAPVSQQKADEIISFLKKLDTNAGHAAFEDYLSRLAKQKEELLRIKEDLVSQILRLYKIQDYVSPLMNKSVEELHDSAQSDITLGQMKKMTEDHVIYGQSAADGIQALKNLISTLSSDQIVSNVDYLEKRFNAENNLIKLLIANGDPAYDNLISELLLQNKITEFFVSYAMTGRTLIDQIKSFINEDTSFLSDLTGKELSVLDLYEKLYTEDDYSKDLQTNAYDLSHMMGHFNADTFENIKKVTDNILNQLNKVKVSPVLPDESKYISDLTDSLEKGTTDAFKKKAAEFSDYLKANAIIIKLSQDEIEGLYGLPIQFKSLIGYSNPLVYRERLSDLTTIYQLIPDYENALKIELKQKQSGQQAETSGENTEVQNPASMDANTSSAQDETADDNVQAEEQPVEDNIAGETVQTETAGAPDEQVNSPEVDVTTPSEQTDEQKDVIEDVSDTDVIINASPDEILQQEENSVADEIKNSAPEQQGENQADVNSDTVEQETVNQPVSADTDTSSTQDEAADDNVQAEEQPVEDNNAGEPVQPETAGTSDEQANSPETDVTAPSEQTDEQKDVTEDAAQQESVKPEEIQEPENTSVTPENPDAQAEEPSATPGENIDTTAEQDKDTSAEQQPAETEQIEQDTVSIEIKPEEIISILEGTNISGEDQNMALAENDPYVQSVNKAIENINLAEKYSDITKGLLDRLKVSDKTETYISELNALQLSADEYDELLSFLNQIIIRLGLVDGNSVFSGKNGVLRFGPECPSFMQWSSIIPYDENEDILISDKAAVAKAASHENEMEADQNYLSLKQERRLNADFCVEQSEDITTKNLIGLQSASKQVTDNYIIDQNGLKIDFFNNAGQDKMMVLESEKKFTVRHEDAHRPGAEIDQVVSEAVDTAIRDNLGKNVVIENLDISQEDNVSSYVMSALESPGFLYTPAGQKQIQYPVIYESDDHRKNYVNIYTDDAESVNSRNISEYTIFNYGDGKEDESLYFENAVLRMNPNGSIEGYVVDDSVFNYQPAPVINPDGTSSENAAPTPIENILQNGRDGGPDFVFSTPFAMNANGDIIKDFRYEISGDKHNRIEFSIKAKDDEYPIAMKSSMTFFDGQTKYDTYSDPSNIASGNFTASQASGDFNGDGISDIAAGSYSSGGYKGSVSVYLMSKNNRRSLAPNVVITGDSSYGIGFSVAAADINGDKKDDLIIGSPFYDNNTGRIWIFDGGKISTNADTQSISLSSADIIIDGSGNGDGFGYFIATGDFNSDSKTDIAVSSPWDADNAGSIHLFFNENLIALANDENLSVIKPLSASAADINIIGENTDVVNFGTKIMSGDFNNDGKSDIAVSAPYSRGDSEKGKVYMFYQDANPWTDSDEVCAKNCGALNADVIFTGEEGFGKSLASGDFNNDGKSDIAIGNPDFDSGTDTNEGIVYIFYQDETLWSSDEECVSCDFTDADVKISGSTGQRFGFSLLSADINSDRITDLLIGSIHAGFDRGVIYGYLGNTSSENQSISVKGFMSTDDSELRMIGERLSYFGYSIISGDFNGDKNTDFSAGAPYFDDFRGKMYIFYGKENQTKATDDEDKHHKPDMPEEEQPEIPAEIIEALPSEESDSDILPDNLGLTPEMIDDALKGSAPDGQDYLLDFSVPEKPVITCDGFVDGVFAEKSYAKCRWTDTAGPSQGVYKYCIDTDNSCAPDIENPNLSADFINLSSHHNYLRVQTSDEGGVSDISVFDIAVDNMTNITSGPSDNSDKDHPIKEGESVTFSVTSQDPEGDPYYLLVCRTNDIPVYTDDKPACLGSANSFCLSDITQSGKPAGCIYKTSEEPGDSSIWYAFVCEKDGVKRCSEPFQGSGPYGSPFYVSHPSRFSQVLITNQSGNPVMPGDLLKFTLPSKNITGVPAGSKVTMYACSGNTTGFDYVENKCLGGSLICSSKPSDPKLGDIMCSEEESENQSVPSPMPAGEKQALVFAEHGERGLIQGIPTQKFTVGNSEPSIINYTNQGSINIPGGGSTKINFSAVVQDLNGSRDIQNVSGVFFDSSTVWNDCAKSNNDCYIADKCALTGIDDKTVKADCLVTIYYNSNAGDEWKAHVNVFDGKNTFTDLSDSVDSRSVPPLVAINQEEITVPYDMAEPGQVAGPVETVLSNLGNVTVDVLISGTDLTGINNVLPRELQKWSTNKDFDYNKDGYPLVQEAIEGGTPANGCADLSLPVHDDSGKKEIPIYWKILVPENQKADVYQGSVYFNPAPDSCTPEEKSSVQDIINR